MIKSLTDADGSWKTSCTDLERLIIAYYENLFATNSPSGFEEAMARLGSKVTDQINEALDANPIVEEIRTATFQMNPTKAPGTDDFHAIFYQKLWDIVGEYVLCLVKKWWRGLIDLKTINKTCVSLISK